MSNEPHLGEPEYLGDEPSGSTTAGPDVSAGSGRRRRGVLAVAAGAVAGVVALGGWAAFSLMSSEDQPASVVPASAVAYLGIDLDPSAEQKVEALRILGKFPALAEELRLDSRDDLRRLWFDRSGLAECEGASYDDDVAPWVGERAAAAVLPGEDGAAPVAFLALQVTDEAAAAESLDELMACEKVEADGNTGFAFTDGYVFLAGTAAEAQAAVDQAAQGTLDEDDLYQRWTAEAGAPGIATFYLAPDGPQELAELAEAKQPEKSWMSYRPGGDTGFGPPPLGLPGFPFGGAGAHPDELTEDFEGMAAVVRFRDRAVELELAGGGAGMPVDQDASSGVRELPDSTGAAFSVALADGWAADLVEQLGRMPLDRMLADAERQSGTALPEDLETLLGESVSVVVDSDLEVGPAIRSEDPSTLRAGVRVVGDPGEILPVVERLQTRMGPAADMLVVEPGEGSVALGLDQAYVEELAGSGLLGEDPVFQAAVPDAERASAVAYVSFDAGDAWVERLVEDFSQLAEGRSASEVRENLAALEALGISTWFEDGTQHGLVRLTTN